MYIYKCILYKYICTKKEKERERERTKSESVREIERDENEEGRKYQNKQ